ncbi:MATE family efflux transporter [Tabrizicola sp. DMG-N-6]|uniref:MATE family efflux transporter n=2 Tax=Szabonella alba TaxID=2804194 RepID=A0A8K0VDT8_9RHOB|nr:MATE family efflux transporter [Szabonella alba]
MPPGLSSGPGGRIVTYGGVARFALPIVLANATVPLLGMVDTAVVGQLGEAAPIGAVGLGAVIVTTLFWIFGFLRMGTTGLAAQAIGAGDGAESTAVLLRALMIGGAAGITLTLLQVPLIALALWLAPGSPGVETMAASYLAIRLWGAPAAIAQYALTGWLVAAGRTRAILAIQLCMNGLNIGLDLWFVLGLGWGVQGVAVATLIAELAGLALALWFCRDAFGAALAPAMARLRDRIALRRMVTVNRDILIRSLLLQFSLTAFLFFSAGEGDAVLAANQVLWQFLIITANVLDGFAFAAEAMVGQAVGARSLVAVRRASLVASVWGGICVLGMSAFVLLAGPALIDAMATAPEVRTEARRYLPWLVAAPVTGIAAWMLDGIFIGATMTRELRRAMILSVAIYLPCLLILPAIWANHGLWAAVTLLNLSRGLTLARQWPALERRVVDG